MNLRKEAKGRQCQIRISVVCNGNSEIVVLCHINNKPLLGVGTGQKPNDIFGAWGCSACHRLIDSGEAYHDGNMWVLPVAVKTMFYEGVFRTQNILLDEGKI